MHDAQDSESLIFLRDWCLIPSWNDNGKDVSTFRLYGQFFGHPQVIDGSYGTSSAIVHYQENVVTCASRRYALGKMHADFKNWLAQHGLSDAEKKNIDEIQSFLKRRVYEH